MSYRNSSIYIKRSQLCLTVFVTVCYQDGMREGSIEQLHNAGNLSSSSLLSKNVKIKIYIACFVRV